MSGKPKHGHSRPPSATYKAWHSMKSRCQAEGKKKSNERYRLKGITVCERWKGKDGFANFLSDMGPRPAGDTSIDRINGNGNYEPGNCRWATRREQQNNTSRNRKFLFDGELLSVSEIARRMGMKPQALRHRLNRGWDLDRAFTTPNQKEHRL